VLPISDQSASTESAGAALLFSADEVDCLAGVVDWMARQVRRS
jgi:hypothetical protein